MEKLYTCPMHPEIKQSKPGSCSICGMRLVLHDGKTATTSDHRIMHETEKISLKSYLPLIVIIGLILLTTFVISFKDLQEQMFAISKTVSYFMIGFFLVFSGFKLIDLKGFADGYFTYDLLAKRWYTYGLIYPFIELFFGVSMILFSHATWLLWLEIMIMTFSGAGVVIKLLKHERFQCACLGTFLKVPLTKITLLEDFGMALLAVLLLLLR